MSQEPEKRLKMKGLVILAALACFAAAQHQALIDYLEQRLLAMEVRLAFCSLPGPGFKNPEQNIKRKSLRDLSMDTGM